MHFDHRNDRSIPFIFFITTILAYGLFVSQTGFYWDDWPFVWIAKFWGPEEFLPAFANIRAFLGPIFYVTTSLVPPVPLYWQIFAVFIRFLLGLFAWFSFRQVWPQHKHQTLIAALLFLVFPAYSQHWVAFTHINQEWIALLFYLLSFGFTAKALRNQQTFLLNSLLAILFTVLGVFPTEYFIGLEPLRFLFIWVILSEQYESISQRFVAALKRWTPYLLIWLVNGVWLAYFYRAGFGSYDVEVVKEPISIFQVLMAIGEAVWKVGIYAWGQVILLLSRSITAPSSLLTVAFIILTFLFFIFYLSRMETNTAETKSFAITALLIGLAGLLLGRVPSFVAGLPLTLQSSWDRFTISMAIGGSLFIVGLVHLLIRNGRARVYVFALLLALSVGQQVFNANIFRRDWEKQQQIFWQLAWRIPAMQPGTALLTDELPIDYETDLSFTAPLNWMYAPDYNRSDLPYAFLYTEKRLGGQSLPSLAPNTKIVIGLRAADFHGSTSKVIVVHMPKDGCLRVLDPARGDEVTYTRESIFLRDAIALSKPNLIAVDSNQIPQLPFLSEPEHTWCYYFAKAELARQQGNLEQVIDLFKEATSYGYKPADPFEWLVFIEAQALTGNLEAAQELSDDAVEADGRVRKGLCLVWHRVQAAEASVHHVELEQILKDFQCPP